MLETSRSLKKIVDDVHSKIDNKFLSPGQARYLRYADRALRQNFQPTRRRLHLNKIRLSAIPMYKATEVYGANSPSSSLSTSASASSS